MTFTVEALYDKIHNYTLGIISNGSAVPSPSFERCLPVDTISLNSTQSVTLPGKGTRFDDLWFSIDLQSGAYKLDASLSSIETASLGYPFSTFDRFGEADSRDRIAFAVESGTLVTSSDILERDRDGLVWIRLTNAYSGDGRNIEFTITKL